jgi:hypothetical protein
MRTIIILAAVCLLCSGSLQAAEACEEIVEREAARLQLTHGLIVEGSRARGAQGIEQALPRDEWQPLVDKFRERLAPCITSRDYSALSDAALAELHAAANLPSFYSADQNAARVMLAVSREWARRAASDGDHDEVDSSHFQQSWWAALNGRQFEAAADFYADHGDVIENPLVNQHPVTKAPIEPGQLRLLHTQSGDDGIQFLKQGVDVYEGRWVLASVSNHCHFSINALTYLDEMDDASALSERLLLVTSPTATGQALELTHRWNEQADHMKMAIAWRQSEWPEFVSFAATPVFFFMEDGELVERHRGWVDDDQGAELVAQMRTFLNGD